MESQTMPFPSLAQKMQTYLELKDSEANHSHSSPNHPDNPKAPLLQKAPVPRRPANKNRRDRTGTNRPIEGSLK